MKKPGLAKNMARHAGVTRGEAADRLDRVVQQILARLRRGQDADLPGLGRFTFGADGRVAFERDERSGRE
jgi:nucleoid DNA-binding protein